MSILSRLIRLVRDMPAAEARRVAANRLGFVRLVAAACLLGERADGMVACRLFSVCSWPEFCLSSCALWFVIECTRVSFVFPGCC